MSDRNDPDSPDYHPEHTGEQQHGDVGSGADFGADLYRLHAAGRVHLPATASAYSGYTDSIHQVTPYLGRMIEAGASALQPLVGVREALHVAFVKTSENCEAAGEALVAIADDYVRTDEAAADAFNDFRSDMTLPYNRQLDQPTPTVPEPTRPDDPVEDLGIYPHGSLTEED